ncbi:helix-turn-helix domain-containing protein [Streptomyces sp. NPDC090306]|uniref:helix-turn-helix domain-containing protein n=1 Tax=unclassified Streptomyces TaxID=2593676 RepID=UPI0036E2EE79
MRRSSAQPNPSLPPPQPFDSLAARRLRAALGMGPEHVAHGMRVSYGLRYVTPDLVVAWERGASAPSTPELTALAGMLWCSPGELIGRPRTLREHRLARGLAPEDVARAVGLELLAYLSMEENDTWRGTERQASALADVLDLTLPDLVSVTGRDGRLASLLRGSVTNRRQSYVRQIAKVVPLDRGLLEDVLQDLHQDYQRRTAAGPDAGTGPGGSADDEFLDGIVDHFWSLVAGNA